MYYFPNLDEQTRLNMVSELNRDICTGLFYEPVSLNTSCLSAYKRLLHDCFEGGTPETLAQKLTPNFFREKDKNGRKIPANIAQTLTFSDFNRYYIRALLWRAISENKSLYVYRAKQSLNERQESKLAVNKLYSDKHIILELLKVFRDYRLLFNVKPQPELLKPNSGLSLRFVGRNSERQSYEF